MTTLKNDVDELNSLWADLVKRGAFSTLIPEKNGGQGKGLKELAAHFVTQGLEGRTNILSLLTQMAVVTLSRYGDDALKGQWLPTLAKGATKVAIAATEAHSGLNMFAIRTSARKVGDGYVINGEKVYASGADVADACLLIARTQTPQECKERGLPKTYGLSLFMLPMDMPGIEMTKMPTRGEPGLNQMKIVMKDLKLPESQRVGPEDGGALVFFDAMNLERIMGGAYVTGLIKRCLNIAVNHAKNRVVFGDKPIGSYQAVQHPLAEVQMRLTALELLVEKGAALFDQREDPQALSALAGTIKYLGAELAVKAVDAAIDALGGHGFNEEAGLIQLWEHARLFKTAPVANNMILNQIAEQVLGLPRSY